MKVIAAFDFGGANYQVAHLQSVGKVQLWFRSPFSEGKWEVGHGREIPQGMTAEDVAVAMQQFIHGELTHEEYQRLLP